jgi:DNA-binding NarL/FixJ family response regulator
LGLRQAIEQDPSLRVVGETRSHVETVLACQELQPDLVLMSSDRTEFDTVSAARAVRAVSPGTRVVVIDDGAGVVGADIAGRISPDTDMTELQEAVRSALLGEARRDAEPALHTQASATHLSPREIEVLQLVARGHTNQDIANILGIKANTVKAHIEHALIKLEARDRTSAVVRAIQLGHLR